ncbi:ABC transporter permease [Cellvibrio sp. KY-YJ-3]|uniref:ABC transporter permease n=1 Tax=Cellvibrio sp. KY-YJ-3 TaxID=454662 RepID=UPI001243B5C4|nr:ABC transporter permease [Cellvibrio sp. KY-YJ-3]QEY11982.1 ABC transporter permease [Cellvibrio sp. KY-YJ-3]
MNKFLQTLLIVWRKEWRDALRDKKSLRMAFLMPVYFVAVFVASSLFIIHMSQQSRATTSEPIKLSVVGAEQLPALVDWLQERGIQVQAADEQAYQQVQSGQLGYALIVPEDAREKFATGESIELALVFDATNNKLQGALHFVRQQIWSWNARVGSLRLLSRGISPAIVNPVMVRDLNVASDQKMGFFVMASLPMLLILTVFMATVGFSADMTAGERERRSLESLLITPAPSGALLLGKWLNSLSLTFLVLVVELSLLAIAFAYVPFKELGLRVHVTPLDLLVVLVALMSLAIVATALQFLISMFARSFKDAQTYMGLMIFIPMVPLFYTLLNPSAYADWFRWVPVLAQQLVVKDLLLGGDVPLLAFAQAWLVAVVLAAIFLRFTAQQLRKPKIVYGV